MIRCNNKIHLKWWSSERLNIRSWDKTLLQAELCPPHPPPSSHIEALPLSCDYTLEVMRGWLRLNEGTRLDPDLRELVVLQGEEETPELSLCLMKTQWEGSCMRVRKRALTEPDHAGTLVWTSRFQNGVHPGYGILLEQPSWLGSWGRGRRKRRRKKQS